MAYGKKIHNLFRWKPQKKRSAAQLASMQKAQSTSTSAPNDDEDSDKENANMNVEREIKQLGERARKYEQNFRNERKKVGRVVQNLCAAKKELQDVTMARDTAQDLLQETRLQLQLKENKVSVLENSKESLEKKNNGLRVRVCRASQQKDKAVQKAREVEQKKKLEFHVQENGVITEASRAIMRDLVSLGVKARSVDAAVGCIAGHLGTTIDGKFTSRSTHRAVVEGGVASTMQIAEEMKSGGGVTISSDGTTHKNINYESRFMNITNEDGTHKSRFLGISAATHHTSEEQLDGWIRVVEYILGIFNSSPRAQSLGKMELHEFLKLLKGMHTNHAEDQKKLVRLVQALKQASERESRGEKALLSMEVVQLMPILVQVGQIQWSALVVQRHGILSRKTNRMCETRRVIERYVKNRAVNNSRLFLKKNSAQWTCSCGLDAVCIKNLTP
ncbi:hypothetical protein L208DRAFT_1386151 [Tricholoma matsutake]|nr:hypothetical protein L208DRAFT_1386151 [Tricholoma matsutake 945]